MYVYNSADKTFTTLKALPYALPTQYAQLTQLTQLSTFYAKLKTCIENFRVIAVISKERMPCN